MAAVPRTLEHLLADRTTGRLADLCDNLGVDLLVLFGSARQDPDTAGDVDLAYSFRHDHPPDDLAVVNAFGEAYGDALDLMPLDRADSVARLNALGRGEVLVERTAEKFAIRQMTAFRDFRDTQHLRDRALAALAR